MDGSQVVPNSFYNFNFGLSHKVGNSILVNHQANLLYKDEYALAVVNSNSYLSESQVVRQIAYSLLVDVTSKNGLILSPFLAYVNYRIPIYYDYGMGSNRNRDVFRYDNHSEIALGFKASKHIKMVELTLAAYFSNFNLSKQKTLAASWSLLPFSNLNLYYSLSAYLHIQNQNASSIQQLVQSHKIGFKVIPNLWLEGYIIAGGFTNLYDPFTNFTYNSLEQYNSIAGANIMVPLFNFKLTIFAGYRHYESESMFVSINNVFEKYNTKEFSYQSFTGGLLWKL